MHLATYQDVLCFLNKFLHQGPLVLLAQDIGLHSTAWPLPLPSLFPQGKGLEGSQMCVPSEVWGH